MEAKLRVANADGGNEGTKGMIAAVAATAKELWVRSDWVLSQEKACLANPDILSLVEVNHASIGLVIEICLSATVSKSSRLSC